MRYLASKTGVAMKTALGFVQGHWKWHHLIDRIQVPIYLRSNYMAIFCIVCEIYRLIGRKSRIVSTPFVFSAPRGVTRRNFVKMFNAGKTLTLTLTVYTVQK